MKNKLVFLLCAGIISTFSYGFIPENNVCPGEPDGDARHDLHKRKKTPFRDRQELSASYDRENDEVIIRAQKTLHDCSVDFYDEDGTLWLHEDFSVISDSPVTIPAESLSAGQYIIEIGYGATFFTLPLDIEKD